MINKIKEAVLDMQSKVEFSDDGHTYQVKSSGEWLQGVSTVSSIVPKGWLSAWGAKEAVKFLGYSDYPEDTKRAEEVLGITRNMFAEDYIKFLKEAKGAAFRKSKEALVDGKAGHKWLEDYVSMRIKLKTSTYTPLLPEGNLKRPIEQFLKWEAENIKEWILCESLVAYPEKGYAGTLDGVALLNNGRYAVIDFKFASHISEDYYLQTAGYQACFEPYGIKIDDRIIIRLPKTLLIEERDKKTHTYSKVGNNIEPEGTAERKIKMPQLKNMSDTELYELDRDNFYNALPLKKWINLMTKK